MENTELKTQKSEVPVSNFFDLDIRFCLIEDVEDILKNPKKEFHEIDNPVKGYNLTVDTGFDKRSIVTNIVHFPKSELKGKTTSFILNFPEALVRGVKSKGMIFMTNEYSLLSGKFGDIII